ARNSGATGAISIVEADDVTVVALRQTGASTGTVSLVSTAGDIALNNGAVVSNAGLITLTAATTITDADAGATASITGTGQATLSAATGIGTGAAGGAGGTRRGG